MSLSFKENVSFIIHQTLFASNNNFTPFYTNKTKGSCGIPQMFWVLTPSHFITNPRTRISNFFLGFISLFSHSFGNNKARWRLSLKWIELINSSISNFDRYRKNGDFAGDRLTSCWSIPKRVKTILFICVYYYCCIILFAWLCFCLFWVSVWWSFDDGQVLHPDLRNT